MPEGVSDMNRFENENDLPEQYLPALRKCGLLVGMPEDQYLPVLRCLNAVFHEAPHGNMILSAGDAFRNAYFVLEGELSVSFTNEASERIVLNHFYPGMLMGESMAVIEDCVSPVEIRAESDSVYLSLRLKTLLQGPCTFRYEHRMLTNLLRMLAKQNTFLNQKARILGQKKIRDRILLYLSSLPETRNGYRILPYTRTELASFLGLNRSAMVRELGKMQDEGIIELKENRIRVLKRHE